MHKGKLEVNPQSLSPTYGDPRLCARRVPAQLTQLPEILGTVEVTLRGGDESVQSELPAFEATDANPVSSASRPSVRAGQRPVVLSAVTLHKHLVHDYPHIWERCHERLSYFVIAPRPTAGALSLTDSEPSAE